MIIRFFFKLYYFFTGKFGYLFYIDFYHLFRSYMNKISLQFKSGIYIFLCASFSYVFFFFVKKKRWKKFRIGRMKNEKLLQINIWKWKRSNEKYSLLLLVLQKLICFLWMFFCFIFSINEMGRRKIKIHLCEILKIFFYCLFVDKTHGWKNRATERERKRRAR